MKSNFFKWSKFYNECIICGLVEFRHKAKGKCLKCYTKERTHRRMDYFRDHNFNKYRLKNENPSLGYIGEKDSEILLNVNKLHGNSKYDFEWKGKKIDVKTSMFHKNKYWKFLLKTQKGLVDYFLLICKDMNKNTKYIFLIPDKEIKPNHFIISLFNMSKYKKYLWKVR